MEDSLLAQVKEREMEILDMIDLFCQDHDIQYSLAAGSALGAVRHQGFIPWDDDMDIMMTRENFTKFYTEWNKAPVEGFYLQFFLWDHSAGINHAKMRMDNTEYLSRGELEVGHHGIWVDIFPLDKLPENSREKKRILCYGKTLIFLSRADISIAKLPFKKEIIRSVLKLIPQSVRDRIQKKCVRNLIISDKRLSDDYNWISLSTLNSLNVIYPRKMIGKITKVNFENRTYNLLADCDHYLRILYGDYMTLPPVNERKLAHDPVKVKA